MPRGIPNEPSGKEAERDAARAARNDRVQEVVLLLSWLTRWQSSNDGSDIEAHLAPVLNASANATMNHVVCVHDGSQRLVWRISDFEALAYFKHLKTRDCGKRGLSRADKMAYLADLASKR